MAAKHHRVPAYPANTKPNPAANNAIDISADGRYLATTAGNTASVWDAKTGSALFAPIKHNARVNSVRISADGLRIVTACQDGSARIWDLRTGHALGDPFRHKDEVHFAEFSPANNLLLTASKDGTACLWEVMTASAPAPPWLAALSKGLAGIVLDTNGAEHTVSVERLHSTVRGLSTSMGSSYYDFWGRWFTDSSPTRRVAPAFSIAGIE
jgi:WD40 repeat protein